VKREGQGKREGRMFFFEKKNQKTFPGCFARGGAGELAKVAGSLQAAQRLQKFFGSFFQKRTAFFACLFFSA
jgi:hypothetical protein